MVEGHRSQWTSTTGSEALACSSGAEVRDRRGARGREPRPHARARAGAGAGRGSGAGWLAVRRSVRDTRLSGPLLESALIAGLTSRGCPGHRRWAWRRRRRWPGWRRPRARPGAVISASHNRFEDNGVKLFAPGGRKLTDEVESALEAELHALLDAPGRRSAARIGDAVGMVVDGADAVDALGRRRAALDRRSWARGAVAGGRLRQRRRLERWRRRCSAALGAKVEVLHDEPDGTNINAGLRLDATRRTCRRR